MLTDSPGFDSPSSPDVQAYPARTSPIFSSQGTGALKIPQRTAQRFSATALLCRFHAIWFSRRHDRSFAMGEGRGAVASDAVDNHLDRTDKPGIVSGQ